LTAKVRPVALYAAAEAENAKMAEAEEAVKRILLVGVDV
jgi:hypothetical protein